MYLKPESQRPEKQDRKVDKYIHFAIEALSKLSSTFIGERLSSQHPNFTV